MLDSLVGSSEAMRHLREYIGKIGRSDAHVLLTGDTGTGKERVAECIHAASPRRSQTFLCINCAAIPDNLFESEFFGYERGAFTGAHDGYQGKLRLAAGGTVFLDEIGELTPMAQAKILRVLENREVFPLGGRRVAPINVRFIAATNQDLEPLVAERKFRKDLYYRLNVVRLHLPPLKERKEDIPELLAFFLKEFGRHYEHHLEGATPDVLECLQKHEWPGNIRELRNLVEAVFVDPPERFVSFDSLPDHFRRIYSRYRTETLSERERLVSILQKTDWNKKRAAKEMNWSRMTLYRKLSKYHITGPADDRNDMNRHSV
jgi:transcriptional regulator with PAS, ATPase and Fis domain